MEGLKFARLDAQGIKSNAMKLHPLFQATFNSQAMNGTSGASLFTRKRLCIAVFTAGIRFTVKCLTRNQHFVLHRKGKAIVGLRDILA